jgi:hypothetical protein
MSNIDLDQLRQRWQQAHAAAEPSLQLDLDKLRGQLRGRTRSAFAGHMWRLLLGLSVQSAMLLWLLQFLHGHWNDAIYRLFALPIAGLLLAQVGVSAVQWWRLRRLDPAAPVLQTRALLDRLRRRQLRVTRWIILSSVLLWFPAILVLFKGLFGADLIDHVHPSVIWVNLLVGLGFLLLGELLLRWLARRYAGSPALHRLLVETAGYSWQRAEQAFDAQLALEQDIDAQGPARVVESWRRRAELPQRLKKPLRRLRWRLLLAACGWATLLLLTGVYNAQQGGQWSLLAAGVLLNGYWIAQMVAAIVHWTRLARLDFGVDSATLVDQLARLNQTQRKVARISLTLAPVFVLLAAQVLGKVVLGKHLLLASPMGLSIALGLIAIAACLWLERPTQQARLERWAGKLLLGVDGLSRELRQRCGEIDVALRG